MAATRALFVTNSVALLALLVVVVNVNFQVQPIEAFSVRPGQPHCCRSRRRRCCGALIPSSSSSSSSSLHAAASSRINQKIDLDSPKVATIDKLIESSSTKKVYCRCWQSNTFPLCDGAHMAHNKETGDNVGPLIISVAAAATTTTIPEIEESKAKGVEEITTIDDTDAATTTTTATITEWRKKFKSILSRRTKNNTTSSSSGDGVMITTTRERLAKMGLSALLSYGWVSNMSYAVTLSLSWYGFSKKTGMSPLAPGQWKPYLAVYAGFYVFNNFLRPFRLGLSVVVSKYFDSFVNFIQTKTKLSRKWSIGIVVFLANICGTLSAMALGVLIASTASGVPIFPPK